MRTILTTNTYQTASGETRNFETDLGANVGDWEVNWQGNELPALSVCDTVADLDFVNGSVDAPSQKHVLPVLYRIFTKADARAAKIRKMLGDVVAAIGIDPYWTVEGKKLALFTRITKAGLIVPAENFEIAGGAVEAEIVYLVNSFEF